MDLPDVDTQKKFNEQRLVKIEFFMWTLVSTVACAFLIFRVWDNQYTAPKELSFFNNILLMSGLIGFPILSKLVFEKLPFERMRYQHKQKSLNKKIDILLSEDSNSSSLESGETILNDFSSQDLRLDFINESKLISDKLYYRSSVNLFVGCIIAFLGVFIFYFLNAFAITNIAKSPNTEDVTQRLLDYLPRFGALFFIEYIAFFFLKQHRNGIEEFRYYEAIKRKRQDDYILTGLINKFKDEKDIVSIIVESGKTINQNLLRKDESTQTIEIQKLSDRETDIFGKLIDLVKQVKK